MPIVVIAIMSISAPEATPSICSTPCAMAAAPLSQTAGEAIRKATGLRLSVLESVIRRNIISTRTPYGYKVRSVDDDSPGSRAGLKPGDVLLEWDGQPIKSRTELRRWIDESERGAAIPIKYARLKQPRRLLDRKPWVEHEGSIMLDP
jgi:S1-C subfamily serine protease